MLILVLESVLSFWMASHAVVVKPCSLLVAALPVSTAQVAIMRMQEWGVKVRLRCTSIVIMPYDTSSYLPTVVSTGSTCTYGDVRLVDGSNQYEGRVEVCINDQWGTVCDISWSSADATTVCKQLGYAYTSSMFEERITFGTLLLYIHPPCPSWKGIHQCQLWTRSGPHLFWTMSSVPHLIPNFFSVSVIQFSKSHPAVAMTMTLG